MKKQNNNKKYGLGKERELKKIFEKNGSIVIRSRGSFGCADMVLSHPKYGWMIVQVKATRQKNAYYKKEMEVMRQVKVPKGTIKMFCIYWSPRKDRKKRGWEHIIID